MGLFNAIASKRTAVFSAAALLSAAGFLFLTTSNESSVAAASKIVGEDRTAPLATFPANAATLGAVPDGAAGCGTAGAARDVTFTVSGISGSPTNVSVDMTFGAPVHTWRGDITATLIAPNGASHVVFGRTGATTATGCGSSSDLAGPYTFNDAAAATNWWTVLGTPTPSGSYRTTALGGAGQPTSGTLTTMNPAFTGVAAPNGTWTLRFTDSGGGDTGAVTAANLTIVGAAGPVADANADFDGDGKTDFAVARGTNTPLSGLADSAPSRNRAAGLDERPIPSAGETKTDGALAPPIYWYVNNSSNGSVSYFQNGDAATDFITPEDFDGDGKDDIVVWTEAPATQAAFKILQSSTNTVRVDFFGQTGDDPAVVGDYDGDGKADPAVYRCPPFSDPDGQCYFFYRGSQNNPGQNITYVPWGFGVDGDFFPLIGDFDGDGKYDFNIQRSNPASPTNAQFVLRRSSDNGVEWINWGLASDFLIPGDYDGDGKHDIMVRRTVSGVRQHWLLTRTGATSFTNWGITGDVSVPGDYDGDGKTDIAIWRGNTDPAQNNFWVLRSSDGAAQVFEWGQCATVNTCDFPVATWAVH